MKLNWNLDDIVTSEETESLFSQVGSAIEEFDGFYRKMTPGMSAASFRRFLEFSESLTNSIQLLYWRAALEEAADTGSQQARMLKNRALDLDLRASDRSRSIWHWIKGKESGRKKPLDPPNAERLFAAYPDMEDYLRYKRSTAGYTLAEREEMIIANKDAAGINPLTELRTLIETEFEYEFRPEGRRARKIRTQAELSRFIHSPDAAERKGAYISLLGKYKANIDKFFGIYRAVAKDWQFESKLRGYPSPIEMRNVSNRVPGDAVSALLDSCSARRGVFHRYFKYKAAGLGVKKLSRYDIYAPTGEPVNKIPFDRAVETVLSAFKEYSEDFHDKALEIIEKKHIDTHPAPAKQGGAFCATPGPGTAPYVLLNYTGGTRDVLTLAHELGHAVHSLYANHLPPSVQHAGLPLAETASTFGEMLVFEKLLRSAGDIREKRQLISRKLQESYATILRQAYFVKFEIEAHSRVAEGLTPESLSDIYFGLLGEQFGSAVEIDSIFRYEWAYIPHIVNSPFYCYAYCFGELLSLSLYSEYSRQGAPFVPRIRKILAAGGSGDPVEILKEAGFEITSPGFWESGFEVLEKLQKELERIS